MSDAERPHLALLYDMTSKSAPPSLVNMFDSKYSYKFLSCYRRERPGVLGTRAKLFIPNNY